VRFVIFWLINGYSFSVLQYSLLTCVHLHFHEMIY